MLTNPQWHRYLHPSKISSRCWCAFCGVPCSITGWLLVTGRVSGQNDCSVNLGCDCSRYWVLKPYSLVLQMSPDKKIQHIMMKVSTLYDGKSWRKQGNAKELHLQIWCHYLIMPALSLTTRREKKTSVWKAKIFQTKFHSHTIPIWLVYLPAWNAGFSMVKM